jgi:hypothetical protein
MTEHLTCRSLAFFRNGEDATLSLTTDKNHFYVALTATQVALLLQDSAKFTSEVVRSAAPDALPEITFS